ncbi:MAG: potassium channel family protein [Ignavibacteriae bacterium]|nr:potassium channel family protein [Ignavibacteriota bacterium]
MQPETNEPKLSLLNVAVLVLSVYVLVVLIIDSFIQLPDEVSRVLEFADNVICILFLIEFCVRFYRAESKLKFMKWGWIDLISSIPTFDLLRGGRALRLIRLLRILRAFRSIKHIITHVFRSKIQGTLTSVSIVAVMVVIFSSIAILQVETTPEGNIKTAEDALWWSYVTITTVGYGDKFPVTTEGRIIASFLMTVGVGLFGTFTAFLSSWFVESRRQEHDSKKMS